MWITIGKRRVQVPHLVTYITLGVLGIAFLFPFVWTFLTSIKTESQASSIPPVWFPNPVVWRNYSVVLTALPFFRMFLNSTIVSICQVFGQVLLCSLAAYAFARLEFPWRDKIFIGYLTTLMIPYYVTIVPLYLLVSKLNWINTYQGLIVPGVSSAFATFLLRQFFAALPTDLEDAAKIDGCSYIRILFTIILPLNKPALGTVAIFTFLGSWNNMLWPLLVTRDMSMKTMPLIPVLLAQGYSPFEVSLSQEMAGAILVVLPIIIFFLLLQRTFTETIAISGIKM